MDAAQALATADGGPTVCIDMDGCLSAYDGWRGGRVRPGLPIPGAPAACQRLADAGFVLVVLTARDDHGTVAAWLEEWGFPRMRVTSEKVPALVYIDDRAHRFTGDWSGVTAEWAMALRPWWQAADE